MVEEPITTDSDSWLSVGFKIYAGEVWDVNRWLFTFGVRKKSKKWVAWGAYTRDFDVLPTFDTEQEAREYAYTEIMKTRMTE